MMYFTALGSLESSPATLLPLVLPLQPSLQRLEIFEQRAAVHLAPAGHGFQRVSGPRSPSRITSPVIEDPAAAADVHAASAAAATTSESFMAAQAT